MNSIGMGKLAARTGVSTLVATCPGHGRSANCPILKALGGESIQ